jgi:4-cresol dehydrogenase (hydroxylating)
MNAALDAFLEQARQAIGAQWVDTRAATLARYGEHTLPAASRAAFCGIVPRVDRRRASHCRRPPTGMASSCIQSAPATTSAWVHASPTSAGQVVVDLGFRMNQILEVNEETCYAECWSPG